MAKRKSPKKGSNFICRVANPSPEKVCEYVKRLPKSIMSEKSFRAYMGKKWFQNEHQAAEQWGLYYIDGTNYYPQFNRELDLQEAELYLYGWLKRLIVINPYTKFDTTNDNNLVLSIVEHLEKQPLQHDLKTILRDIIKTKKPFIVNDILFNTLNKYSEVLSLKEIDQKAELFSVELKPNYKKIINTKYNMNKKDYFDLFKNIKITSHQDEPRQQIFYGAPGTGKSYIINENTEEDAVIRTTFHPDSDYSTFVGSYKPAPEIRDVQVVPVVVNKGAKFDLNKGTYKENHITYTFVIQAFLKAYLGAWKKYAEAKANNTSIDPQFLIIEEINRGNCAQIFGDLFQLLDRSENGFSEYPIDADTDLQKAVKDAFENHNDYKLGPIKIDAEKAVKNYTSNYGATLSEDIQEGRVLLLPPNLYIWATMNTSDQSLFPIDSAFKRRWEWKYIKIKKGKDEKGKDLDWKIVIKDESNNTVKIDGNDSLLWWDFLNKINEIIASMTSSADKQLGYFFCKADSNGEIGKDLLVNKVIFYLWNDVFKDYGFEDAKLFKYEEGGETKDLTFPMFFDEDGENANHTRLVDFLEKVMKWKSDSK